jgi:hypothetical protein
MLKERVDNVSGFNVCILLINYLAGWYLNPDGKNLFENRQAILFNCQKDSKAQIINDFGYLSFVVKLLLRQVLLIFIEDTKEWFLKRFLLG